MKSNSGEEKLEKCSQGRVQNRKCEQASPNIFATRQFTPSLKADWRTHRTQTMADVKKQEKDFTPEVDALLPEVDIVAKVCVQLSYSLNVLNSLQVRATP